RLLARDAWSSQQSKEDNDIQRPDNLFEPQQSLHQIHGRFISRSRESALALTSMQVSVVLGVLGLLCAVILLQF
ncbi:hypothetical protein ACMYM2_23505, partial [Salmonella enterica subsp. enterica serovar Enteritidis]